MRIKRILIKHFKGLETIEVDNCGAINAFIGKNNSGKTSILHAIEIASLALKYNNWNAFQPKMDIKDLFSDIGSFEIEITYENQESINISSNDKYGPKFNVQPEDYKKFESIIIFPDSGTGLAVREERNPKYVIRQIRERNYRFINSLDILWTINYYASHESEGFKPADYSGLINEILEYFPELQEVESDLTEEHRATLTYKEYGKKLDILYSGTGLKHFLDVLLKTTISGANIVLLDEPELGLHPDLQRQFIEYLDELSKKKKIQFFMATHSPVLLNYADVITYFKVVNAKGARSVIPVKKDAIHTLLADIGIRPSDVFNQDMCILVEGPSDVIFFEHIIRILYKDEFSDVAVGIQQYGGSTAEGIIKGTIDISNITTAQKYTFWIHDRDEQPNGNPSTQATKFKNKLDSQNIPCHILKMRELEYYYPEVVHVNAQQNDSTKETATIAILIGDQSQKYDKAAKNDQVCVPSGVFLRKLLKEHVTTKDQINREIRDIIENKLIPWKNEILGINE